MKPFVDREKELEFLEQEYQRENSSLIILYGRRRVGKTALATKFMEGKPSLYFLVTEESEQQNRNAFKDTVADFCGNELLKSASLTQWEPIFKTLCEKRHRQKLLLILDEFQYLGKSNPAFPSVFQKIWDTFLKQQPIMVILCGSLISMMESQTLSYSSPLYGRRTGQIKLRQIPFSHYRQFFPEKSHKELVEYYSVTGGVPKYIELFHDTGDIYTAIQRSILSKSSFLFDEPNFLLQREVSELGSYFSIMKAIAAGNQKLGKIAGVLEVKQTGLSKYLKTLVDLDLLEREVPVTEENPEKSKRGLYKIKDNFMLFWFRFVYPNMGLIESGNEQAAMNRIRANLVDNHISYVYEDVCREKMWQLAAAGQWDFLFDKVGRWWNGNTEIDLIALDSQGENIIFGECKYWEGPVGVNVLNDLTRKAKEVEWKRDCRREHFILFSISGFTEELEKLAASREDILLQN
jgi:AAA+ ATPase superfamily predicted ATPase